MFNCNENEQTLFYGLFYKNTNMFFSQRLYNSNKLQSHLKEWQLFTLW